MITIKQPNQTTKNNESNKIIKTTETTGLGLFRCKTDFGTKTKQNIKQCLGLGLYICTKKRVQLEVLLQVPGGDKRAPEFIEQ